ncbi:MAG: elongation factor 1-beta family protein [Candidatus Diapherotrites archaeon]
MGNALIIMKIYPEELEDSVKIEKSVKKIKNGEVKEVRLEPIAFGLELVKIAVVIPDKEDGAMSKLEDEIKALPGVRDVEVEGVTLL